MSWFNKAFDKVKRSISINNIKKGLTLSNIGSGLLAVGTGGASIPWTAGTILGQGTVEDLAGRFGVNVKFGEQTLQEKLIPTRSTQQQSAESGVTLEMVQNAWVSLNPVQKKRLDEQIVNPVLNEYELNDRLTIINYFKSTAGQPTQLIKDGAWQPDPGKGSEEGGVSSKKKGETNPLFVVGMVVLGIVVITGGVVFFKGR